MEWIITQRKIRSFVGHNTKRVLKSALLLDEKRPSWYTEIHAAHIKMRCTVRILEQLYPSYGLGLNDLGIRRSHHSSFAFSCNVEDQQEIVDEWIKAIEERKRKEK
jgi:hypothetical protein